MNETKTSNSASPVSTPVWSMHDQAERAGVGVHPGGRREGVYYHALQSITRREILELIALCPQQPSSLALALDVSRPTISYHLRILEDAKLIRCERRGRRRILRLSDEVVTRQL